ncbi:conserved hypothetical protein [Cupriavidus taiwanensis]|uniref:zeta toxin family protein n=1 Tax=Cupriavidus taiwanensis TaxID=164546 RepID=UPI000E149E13|nr:zeta toxin family protein [Cupriavidus taiwanensis]SPA23776.1 conserved hypothetical protein [Cupriavidus taiwanensis]
MTDTENKNESTVICFAGPNGSGKSTQVIEAVQDYGLAPEAYINADDIARSLEGEIADYRERNIKAAEIAEQRRLAALDSGKDFAFETVMSTPEKVALLTQAQARGYEVALIFVSTNDPEINVARVATRVALGGHSVDPEAVRDRYRRAHELLACAVEHADVALVHDNSATKAQHVVVAQKFEGQVQFFSYAERDTSWSTVSLEKPWRDRVASRSELLSVMVQRAADHGEEPPAEPKQAEAFNGADYMGLVLAHTDHHVLQVSAKGEYILHDRQLLATDVIKDGAWQCLQYRYSKGKIDRSALLNVTAPEEKANLRPKP